MTSSKYKFKKMVEALKRDYPKSFVARLVEEAPKSDVAEFMKKLKEDYPESFVAKTLAPKPTAKSRLTHHRWTEEGDISHA